MGESLQDNGSRFRLTLKAWPVIALATIGLCYATQLVAGWLGIDLPEQKNVDVVRALFAHAFDNAKLFGVCVLNVALILAVLPAVEELIFRGVLFKCLGRLVRRFARGFGPMLAIASVSAVLFSAAHYIAQPWPDNAFLALFLFGLAQCWLYRETDRIWCPILNHALFNLTNLVLLLVLPQG